MAQGEHDHSLISKEQQKWRKLFTVSENCRPGSNGLKLRKKKFRWDIRGEKKPWEKTVTGQLNSQAGKVPVWHNCQACAGSEMMVWGWKKQRGFDQTHRSQLGWKEYFLVWQALLQVMAHSDTWNYRAELLLWMSPAASSDAPSHISFIHHAPSLPFQMWMNST